MSNVALRPGERVSIWFHREDQPALSTSELVVKIGADGTPVAYINYRNRAGLIAQSTEISIPQRTVSEN